MSGEIRLLLASGSPRRRQLLGRLGLDFDVVVPDVDETPMVGESPDEHVLRVARAKAGAVADQHRAHPVLAADTMVVCDGVGLGKPADRGEALAMLERLSGRSHHVVTAVCLQFDRRSAIHIERAKVVFATAPRDLLAWYVASGEPLDKAGAYAIQGIGALLIERVEGNVQAVVGLPLAPLPRLFEQVGLHLVPGGPRLHLAAI